MLKCAFRCIVAPAGAGIAVVHQCAAGVVVALKALHGKGAAAGHGHSAMVEQVAVLNVVHAALCIEKFNMLLQFFALAEGLHQLAQHQLFIRVQCGRVGGVHRGERGIPQRILLFADLYRVFFPVDAAQIISLLHLEVRVAVDDMALQLEHQNADGLVHHRAAVQHALGIGTAGRVGVGHPDGQIVLPIELLGHALQMAQVDAVAVLQHSVVMISQRGLEHRADADGAARSGTHPYYIVVAPLDIHIVVAHKQIEDDIRAWAAVEQVAHDVQLVHCQMLDQLTQPHDKAVGAAIFNDAAHDLAVVQILVVILKMGVEQLVQNVAAAGRQTSAHMVAGMLGGHQTADINEPQQRFGVPLIQRFLAGTACLELGQLFVWVIDQRCQLGAGMLRHGIAQHLIHFFANDTGSGIQNMHKSFILAVQVATDEDIVQISFGYGMFTGALGLHYGLEKLGATVVPNSSGNTEKALMYMRDFGTTALVATPSYALYMCETAKELDYPMSDYKLRLGLFGSEGCTPEMRTQIEKGWVLFATDNYGMSELMGPGVSGECEERDGLHFCEDYFYPEIVDPETLEPLAEGETGELLVTTLTKEGIPLLRYRTRDITRLNYSPCKCGRTGVRMDKVKGRSDDMLKIRGVNVFPSQIESVLIGTEQIGANYQLVVRREGFADTLEVRVELVDASLLESYGEIERLQKKIMHNLQTTLGIQCKVSLLEPKTLERFVGKAHRVVDLRNEKK